MQSKCSCGFQPTTYRNGVQGVEGSNPFAPTKTNRKSAWSPKEKAHMSNLWAFLWALCTGAHSLAAQGQIKPTVVRARWG